MPNTCKNCGATIQEGDTFCTSCGASKSSTNKKTADTASNEPWRKLLDAGEEPVIVIKNVTLRLPYRTENKILWQWRRRWQVFGLDAVVVSGQKLLFIRKDKILDITRDRQSAGRFGQTLLPGAFTVDPLIVRKFAEERKQAREKSKTAAQEEIRKNLSKGFFKSYFSKPSEEYVKAANSVIYSENEQQYFPPLIWLGTEKHSLRPLGTVSKRLMYLGGCLAALISAVSFGLLWPVFVLIGLLFSLISIPFRMKPWVGIQIRSTIWSMPESGLMEIAIFDGSAEKQLFTFLEPRVTEIQRILHESGQFTDHPWMDFVKGIREYYKTNKEG